MKIFFSGCRAAILSLSLFFILSSGCSSQAPGDIGYCPESSICFEQPEYILVCSEEDGSWEAEKCDEGKLCFNGECLELMCIPGTSLCENDSIITCRDDGQGFLYPESCQEGEACFDGFCLERICEEGEFRCTEDEEIQHCVNNGTQWSLFRTCPENSVCVGEICLPAGCTPGDTECGPDYLNTCNENGEWVSEPCPEGNPCLFGRCVSCVSHDSCDEGEICVEGNCVLTSPELITLTLPPGTEGVPYDETIEFSGGLAPYTWEITGDMPAGIEFRDNGNLSGTPAEPGTTLFSVKIIDDLNNYDEKDYSLEIVSAGGDLKIMTSTLTDAMHGLPYEFSFNATGGVQPYAWQVLEGELPAGIELFSHGRLQGVPDEMGDFPLTIRVIDALNPPSLDTAEFILNVQIAPLVIYGEREYDLLFTKIIVLPMVIPFIPYSAQLQARGGLQPYTWNEEPAPPGLDWVISDWGLPSDLSLGSDGVLSGWMTDISDAVEVSIPFTDISMKGYFFNAQVTDSQDPEETKTAVFCVPTVPL